MGGEEEAPVPPLPSYKEEGFTFRPQLEKKEVSAAEVYREVEALAAGNEREEERMLQEIDELEELPVGSRQTVLIGTSYLRVTKRTEDNPAKKQSAEYDIERGLFGVT